MSDILTLVIGASEKPDRYANMAVRSLRKHGHPVVAIGSRIGQIDDVKIQTGQPPITGIDTVTLYLSQKNQLPIQDYLLSLNPKRIIFNPGAENPDLAIKAEQKGIETLEACTLVLLSTNQY